MSKELNQTSNPNLTPFERMRQGIDCMGKRTVVQIWD